jgi:short-subunit dehydrogenase
MTKKALITGASSGIGLSTAVYLIDQGYDVYGTSRKLDKLKIDNLRNQFLKDNKKYRFLDSQKKEIKAVKTLIPTKIKKNIDDYIKKIQFVIMDVTDSSSVQTAIEEIEAKGSIDILINNAGQAFYYSVIDGNLADVQRLFEVNFFGHLRVLQQVVPKMVERQAGFILNITSVAALVGVPFISQYAATKAGMERITEGLRLELKPFNIKVTSLLPGDINTAIDSNMVMAQSKKTGLESTDISDMLDTLPIRDSSPYYPYGLTTWEIFVRNHILAPPPLLVAKKAANIIGKKNPKIHYKVGNFLQTKCVTIMQKIFPENLNMKILAKLYGL